MPPVGGEVSPTSPGDDAAGGQASSLSEDERRTIRNILGLTPGGHRASEDERRTIRNTLGLTPGGHRRPRRVCPTASPVEGEEYIEVHYLSILEESLYRVHPCRRLNLWCAVRPCRRLNLQVAAKRGKEQRTLKVGRAERRFRKGLCRHLGVLACASG